MLERFFTEVVSNTVVLDDVAVLGGADAASRLLKDSRPLRLLLHEKTHHASFDGSVGAALGAVAAWAGTEDDGGDHEELPLNQRDLLMLRSAYQVLEPLVEGLALFAEHDNVPGPAPVASAVAQAAGALLFGPGQDADGAALRQLLWYQRGQDDWIAEKTHLLAQPFDKRPTYLLGYLAVKGLYWRLVRQCPRLVDTDLFVLLMLDYWFRDRLLAERLARFQARRPDELFDDLQWLIEYLMARANQLLHDVDAFVDELIAYVESAGSPFDQGGGPGYRNAAFVDRDAAWLGVSFRSAALERASAAGLFRYRTDFRFSSTAVTVEVSPERRVRLSSAARQNVGDDIPAVPLSGIGTFDGTLEGVVTPACGGRTVFIISALDGLVAVRDLNARAWNPPDLVKYFDAFPSAVEVQRAVTRLAADHERTAAVPRVVGELPRFDRAARQAVHRVYLPWVAGWLPGAELNRLATALAPSGFVEPLGDARLLNVLGRVSLRCGCHVWTMHEAAAAQGWDLPALTSDIDAINARIRPLLDRNPLMVRNQQVASLI